MLIGESKLDLVDPQLAAVVRKAGQRVGELQVICGFRGKAEQDKAVAEGKSKTPWPTSKHNSNPSLAVDLAIRRNGKIDWNALRDWYFLAGIMIATAAELGVKIRWGGDWDRDQDFGDQKFNDLPHFELVA